MFRFKMIFPVLAIVVLGSALAACGGLPGGGGAPTTAPAGPTTAAGAPTAAPAQATAPFAPTATTAVTAPTEAPPRNSPTPPPTGVADPSTLAASAGPKCEDAFSKPVAALQNVGAPETPVLTMLNKEYEGRTWVYNPITSIRGYATDGRNVRSLLCIVETRKVTDKYPDGSPIYQVTWEARFLKWPEGSVLRVRGGMLGSQIFTAFPKPAGNEFYGGRPDAQLIEFVKEALGGG